MNGFRLSDIISAIKRRYWLVIVSVMIIAPIAVTVAFMLPSKYKATANVLVQDQQIPVNLAGQTVTSTAYERLSRIRQRLLASEQLLRLVDELDVFAGRPDMTPGEKVSHMRRNITIEEVIGGTQRNPKLAAIKVSFTDGAPGRAARIANALVDVILTWNIEDRRGVAKGTAEFFEDQVNRFSRDIASIEQKISDYQAENNCCLPSTLLQRQNQLAALQGQSVQREQNIFTLEEQIRTLEQQLRDG
ncbi:MAG: Wzz/FepE/Etk N-terminal domain-containing protein, partial [Pseudomonadota bacterium]